MFQLHDKTRRRVCVVGFIALGVLPTLAVGCWCLSRHVPGYARAEAQELSRRLGLDVTLGGLKHVRPGVVLYEQFEAADPETGQTILRCRLLEIARGQRTDQQGRRRAAVTMTASQPVVETASLDRVWQCLQRTLEGSYGPLEADFRFRASEMTLQAAHDAQTLTAVQGAIERLSGGVQAQLDFRLAGADAPEPAHIRVVRNRQASPPASGFELSTGGGELPCNVLAMGLAELAPLGPRCRFRGSIWANETPDGWQGELAGQLVALDLGALVTDHFPHRLAGSADVTIQSARFRRGRLEEGSATVTAGPGTIDRSLIASAIDRLGLVAGAAPPSDDECVPYGQLAFLVTLDAQGLHLFGRCSSAEPGTILSHDGRRLLGEPIEQPTSAVALVRTLVPQNAVQVPATRQTDWLLRHLPVPEVILYPGVEPIVPHARVRLRETWRR